MKIAFETHNARHAATIQTALHGQLINAQDEILPKGLKTIIPNASVVEKMGEEGTPVELLAPGSVAADAYRRLWKEINRML